MASSKDELVTLLQEFCLERLTILEACRAAQGEFNEAHAALQKLGGVLMRDGEPVVLGGIGRPSESRKLTGSVTPTVLAAIEAQPGIRPIEISRALKAKRQSVRSSCDILLRRGLVTPNRGGLAITSEGLSALGHNHTDPESSEPEAATVGPTPISEAGQRRGRGDVMRTVAQYYWANQGSWVPDASRALGLEAQIVRNALYRMEKRGLAKRAPNGCFTLTKKGWAEYGDTPAETERHNKPQQYTDTSVNSVLGAMQRNGGVGTGGTLADKMGLMTKKAGRQRVWVTLAYAAKQGLVKHSTNGTPGAYAITAAGLDRLSAAAQ